MSRNVHPAALHLAPTATEGPEDRDEASESAAGPPDSRSRYDLADLSIPNHWLARLWHLHRRPLLTVGGGLVAAFIVTCWWFAPGDHAEVADAEDEFASIDLGEADTTAAAPTASPPWGPVGDPFVEVQTVGGEQATNGIRGEPWGTPSGATESEWGGEMRHAVHHVPTDASPYQGEIETVRFSGPPTTSAKPAWLSGTIEADSGDSTPSSRP